MNMAEVQSFVASYAVPARDQILRPQRRECGKLLTTLIKMGDDWKQFLMSFLNIFHTRSCNNNSMQCCCLVEVSECTCLSIAVPLTPNSASSAFSIRP